MDGLKFTNEASNIVEDRERIRIDRKQHSDAWKKNAQEKLHIFHIWSAKTLGNNKAIMSSNIADAPMYEITHNGNTGETYVDTYIKINHEVLGGEPKGTDEELLLKNFKEHHKAINKGGNK